MDIQIIAVGQLKSGWLTDACEDYMRRLTPLAQIRIVEIKEEPLPSKPLPNEIISALSKEAKQIIKRLPLHTAVIPLAIEGKIISSEEFALYMEEQRSHSMDICFIIGSSHGLGAEIKAAASWCLSLGLMTLPHQLSRIVLLEQLYRAHTILGHIPYHK